MLKDLSLKPLGTFLLDWSQWCSAGGPLAAQQRISDSRKQPSRHSCGTEQDAMAEKTSLPSSHQLWV